MKAHILFDDSGEIDAMHVILDDNEPSKTGPRFSFREAPGKHVTTLEVPAELATLSPMNLHLSVKVDRSRQEPRLIAKDK